MSEPGPLVLSRIRAGVLAWLWDQGESDFTETASALSLPNNTLSGHLQRLEAAGYVELHRGFLGRKPRTRIVMTAAGRRAWLAHLTQLTGRKVEE